MKVRQLVALCIALIAAMAFSGQGDKRQIQPIPEELLQRAKAVNSAIERGEALLDSGQTDGALAELRQAVTLEEGLPGGGSSALYALAKALVIAGNPNEALDFYARAVKWDERTMEWRVYGPPTLLVAMDYAILAAEQGRHEKAQEMYYFGLRNFNVFGERAFEPIPFLVIFEPEPSMVHWEYSAENLIAAALMAKEPYMGDKTQATLKEVQRRKPKWMLPVAFEAMRFTGERRKELREKATRLARDERELDWLARLDSKDRRQEEGARLRKGSPAVSTRPKDSSGG